VDAHGMKNYAVPPNPRVQRTVGILPHFQAFFWLRVFS
jgi:hypothetical protein